METLTKNVKHFLFQKVRFFCQTFFVSKCKQKKRSVFLFTFFVSNFVFEGTQVFVKLFLFTFFVRFLSSQVSVFSKVILKVFVCFVPLLFLFFPDI